MTVFALARHVLMCKACTYPSEVPILENGRNDIRMAFSDH